MHGFLQTLIASFMAFRHAIVQWRDSHPSIRRGAATPDCAGTKARDAGERSIGGHLVSALIIIAALAQPAVVLAHVGPPYVVLPERDLGPYRAIVWADPDVGGGLFLIDMSQDRRAVPPEIGVTLSAAPQDGRTLMLEAVATREDAQDGTRFVGRLPFDTLGTWQVRLQLTGSAQPAELRFPVEVTSPDPSWVESLLCLTPFLLLGLLWLWAARRQPRPAA